MRRSHLATLPGEVAATAIRTTDPSADEAASTVAPVVTTSSTSTHVGCAAQTARNRAADRDRVPRPAWRGHQVALRSASTTGTAQRLLSAWASARAGSTPCTQRRTRARGMGTSAVAVSGTTSTIAAARTSAAERSPLYFNRWTSTRAGPLWRSAVATSTPPTVVVDLPEPSLPMQGAQRSDPRHAPQPRHTTMCRLCPRHETKSSFPALLGGVLCSEAGPEPCIPATVRGS